MKMNKPVHLRLSVLDVSKMVMHEYRYDCVKPKCEKKAKICNMDMDNFIVHGKLEDIYGDLAGDIFKIFRKDFTHFTIKSKDHHS